MEIMAIDEDIQQKKDVLKTLKSEKSKIEKKLYKQTFHFVSRILHLNPLAPQGAVAFNATAPCARFTSVFILKLFISSVTAVA